MPGRKTEERDDAAHFDDVESEIDRRGRSGHLQHDVDAEPAGDRLDRLLYSFDLSRLHVECVKISE